MAPNPVGTSGTGTRYTIPRVAPTPEPVAWTVEGSAPIMLTTSDGSTFHVVDFMKVIMESMQTTNKVLSKDQESESTKQLRLAEAEVHIVYL